MKYEVDDNIQINENSINYKEFMNYVNDSYKNKVISKLSDDQLVEVILYNPTYKLRPDSNFQGGREL